jgi:hypothetical protein
MDDEKRKIILAALAGKDDPDEVEGCVGENLIPPGVPGDREHLLSPDCWCEPELIADCTEEGGEQIWLHREIH